MKIKIILFILLFIIPIARAQENTTTYKKIEKVIELIDKQYVDTVNMDALIVEAINAMAKKLDPHTKYLTAEELKKNNEAMNGSFGGIGIQYQILYDTLLILSVTPGGPSDQAGVRAGDKIILIDGDTVIGKTITHNLFTSKLRGKVDTKVILTIKRRNSEKLENIEITRGSIAIKNIEASYMLDKETGYLKINGFSFTTINEFNIATNLLKFNGMQNLILDLRGNPGGLMIASINLADEFLEPGELIVYTEGAHYKREEYKSTSRGEHSQTRLIILMDELSASASEIVAGAIQDLDRGLIMGRRSYGKGLVGRNFTLPDGSAIRITTGHYYTPSGRCIQKPYENGVENYKNDIVERYNRGEMISADSIKILDSLVYQTKNGRIIYGGGGIVPDIFVPIDTNKLPEFHIKLNQKGIINAFAGAYFDKNFEQLTTKYYSINQYKKSFIPTETTLKGLIEFAENYYKIDVNHSLSTDEANRILLEFKAYLARNIFSGGAYYQIIWETDQMITQALEVMNNKKEFRARKIYH